MSKTVKRNAAQSVRSGVRPRAGAGVNEAARAMTRHSHTFKIEAFDRDGNPKWTEEFDNLVVNEGLDEILDKFYKGSSYSASHFVGLTGSTPSFAAGDTESGTHAGWTENTDYSEASRQAYNPGAVSSQSVDNSASKAVFSINATTTVGGAFLSTDNTKGGTTGTLIGGGAFSGDRGLESGDTLNVTVTASNSSS